MKRHGFVLLLFALLAPFPAYAGDEEPATREELRRLATDFDEFPQHYARLKAENGKLRDQLQNQAMYGPATENSLAPVIEEYLEKRLADGDEGQNRVLISGFAVANFMNSDTPMASSFGAKLVPIILWRPHDRILFEAEIEFGLDEEETEVELGYAQVTFIVNDFLTIGVGKFLLPFGTFWERWHPAWINKLPTMPLINMHGSGQVGESGLGIQLRGGAPIGETKINYVLYVINGPGIEGEGHHAGSLEWERNVDNNNNKSVGGRVGFLPVPTLEVGFSFLVGRVDDAMGGFGGLETFMGGFDLWHVIDNVSLGGRVEIRAEYVWTDTDNAEFEDADGNPVNFDNKRSGWFVQIAFRPTHLEGDLGGGILLKNFELIVRFDSVQNPGPGEIGEDFRRLTVGLTYWIMPNVAVKVAWFHHRIKGDGEFDAVIFQVAVGF